MGELEKLLAYQVDGVVLASATLSSRLAGECRDAGIPVVLFNRDVPGSPASSVVSDNRDGGRQVARFPRRRRSPPASPTSPGAENASTNRDREAGVRRRARRGGASSRTGARSAATRPRGAVTATHELMRRADPPDALFVANDHMAFAVIDVLRGGARGVAFPRTSRSSASTTCRRRPARRTR